MKTKIREEDIVTVKVMKVVTLEMTEEEFNKIFDAIGNSNLSGGDETHYKTMYEFYKTLEDISASLKI